MSANEYLEELKQYMNDGSKLRIAVVCLDSSERWLRCTIKKINNMSILVEYSPYTKKKFKTETDLLNLLSLDIISVTKMSDDWKGWEEGEWPQWGGLKNIFHRIREFFTDSNGY